MAASHFIVPIRRPDSMKFSRKVSATPKVENPKGFSCKMPFTVFCSEVGWEKRPEYFRKCLAYIFLRARNNDLKTYLLRQLRSE